MTNLLLYNLLNNICKRNLHHVRESSSVRIPKRVKRDNLSILRDLASTVKMDYRGTKYQFMDDPFLIPVSGMDKKVATLSTQSGRNAARYVMQQYPNLFLHDTSFPVLKDFSPPPVLTATEGVVGELQNLISLLQPLPAYAAYKKAVDEEADIPRAVVDDLLDLLCFSNSSPLPTPLPPDTRFYMDGVETEVDDKAGDGVEEWKADGPAEGIFEGLTDASLRNISSIIKARAKFKAYDSAYQEYHKLMQSKTRATADVYTSILSILHHIIQDPDDLWEAVLGILRGMNDEKIPPSVDTFNSALYCLYQQHPSHAPADHQHIPIDIIHKRFNQALALVAELVSCKLAPSLTTWWLLLEISYPNYKTRGNVIHNVIEYIVSNNTPLRQPTDFEFFESAMSKCLKNVRSLDAAKRLHGVVEGRGLEGFLGRNNKTSAYFTSYLSALIQHDNIDNTMREYYNIVPNMYAPRFKVMTYLLKAVELHYAYNHLSGIWKDMISFRYHRKSDLLTQFLGVMARAPKDEKLELEYVAMVDEIFKLYLQDLSLPHLNKPLQLSGEQVSEMMLVYMSASQHHKAWDVLKKFLEVSKTGCGLVKEESLTLLCQHFVKENDFDKTQGILKVMQEYGLSSVEVVVEEACDNMQLSQQQKIQLKNVLTE